MTLPLVSGDHAAIKRLILDIITQAEAVELATRFGPELVARAILASARHRLPETRKPGYEPGVWIDAVTPDPIAVLRARPESWRPRKFKSISGWRAGGSPRIAGTLEMLTK